MCTLFCKAANTVVLIFAVMYSNDNLGRDFFLGFYSGSCGWDFE